MRISLVIVMLVCTLQAGAQIFDVTAYGAAGDGSTVNTLFIQSAVDACNSSGGGIVRFPPGNFVTATVFLKSNVIIQIDSGPHVTGSPSTADYPDVTPLIRSYTDHYTQRSVFYAEGQHNIGITGKGTFHGNGLSLSFIQDSDNKPYGFRFISCTNVRYEGITMRNSGFWMMHNQNIDTLLIKNLTIVNQNFGNGDGIGIDGCKNVIVDSCTADCNDDPIVIKTTSLSSAENISISNCTVMSYSRAIKIGTETHGAFKNIHINNITVLLSTTAPIAAKCGINLSVVDGGSMENVLIENITMTGIKVPLLIRLGNRGRKYTDTAATPGVGFMRNVELRNITATASTNVTSSITGIPGHYAQNIRLRNVDITFPGGQPAVGNGFVVPENVNGGPEATIFGDTLPGGGLYMRHVDSMLLENVCFHALQPDQRPDLVTDDVQHLDTSAGCGVSRIEEAGLQENIRIYPNPLTGGAWKVETGPEWIGADLAIVDLTGRVIRVLRLTGTGFLLSGEGFEPGVYLLTGGLNGRRFTGKLFKQ